MNMDVNTIMLPSSSISCSFVPSSFSFYILFYFCRSLPGILTWTLLPFLLANILPIMISCLVVNLIILDIKPIPRPSLLLLKIKSMAFILGGIFRVFPTGTCILELVGDGLTHIENLHYLSPV